MFFLFLTASDPNAALWPARISSPTPTTLMHTRASTTLGPSPLSGLTPRTCRIPCGTLDACTLDAHVHAGRLDTHAHSTSMQDTLTFTPTQEAQRTPSINMQSGHLTLCQRTRAHPRQLRTHPHTQHTVDKVIRLFVIVMKFNSISLFDLISMS